MKQTEKTVYVVVAGGKYVRIHVGHGDKLPERYEILRPEDIEYDARQIATTARPKVKVNRIAVLEVLKGGLHAKKSKPTAHSVA
jgi:hypothetical protein